MACSQSSTRESSNRISITSLDRLVPISRNILSILEQLNRTGHKITGELIAKHSSFYCNSQMSILRVSHLKKIDQFKNSNIKSIQHLIEVAWNDYGDLAELVATLTIDSALYKAEKAQLSIPLGYQLSMRQELQELRAYRVDIAEKCERKLTMLRMRLEKNVNKFNASVYAFEKLGCSLDTDTIAYRSPRRNKAVNEACSQVINSVTVCREFDMLIDNCLRNARLVKKI